MNVELLPEAQSDIRSTIAYYRTFSPALANTFMSSVSSTLLRLETFPQSGHLVGPATRRIVIKNFPYGIFYRVENETIFVLSVAHLKRKPRDWDA